MRWSHLEGKEIINLMDGARLGRVGEADLVIDPETGRIDGLLLQSRGGVTSLFARRPWLVPWTAVRKVGPETFIVELATPANAGSETPETQDEATAPADAKDDAQNLDS